MQLLSLPPSSTFWQLGFWRLPRAVVSTKVFRSANSDAPHLAHLCRFWARVRVQEPRRQDNISWPHRRRSDLQLDPAATALLSRYLQLEMLSLPEGPDLPSLPHLHWLSAPEFFDGGFAIIPENLPPLEYYVAVTDECWSTQTDIAEVVRVLLALSALHGAMLSLNTPSALRKLSVEIPHLARIVLAGSP
ncbi:hypothetical protein FB451DRAFT_1183990 [Mycena latifolia]|nr:hypothetical protein FB451DRAFT_1183990 [Mycena latifolia]